MADQTAEQAARRAEIIRGNKSDVEISGGMSKQQAKRYDRDAAKYEAEAKRKMVARKKTRKKR